MLMSEDNRTIKMNADQRRKEVATILGAGVLRYRRMARVAACSAPHKSADSRQNSLGPATIRAPVCPLVRAVMARESLKKGHTA